MMIGGGGGAIDPIDGYWKPTKDGLGMQIVIEYIKKHYPDKKDKTNQETLQI